MDYYKALHKLWWRSDGAALEALRQLQLKHTKDARVILLAGAGLPLDVPPSSRVS